MFRNPLFWRFCIVVTSKRGFRNQFQTPSLEVRKPHFLRFGLPEPLLSFVWEILAGVGVDGVRAIFAFFSFLLRLSWGSPKASHIKASHPPFPHFPRFRVRIFRIFRVFCAFAQRNLLRPLFFWGERDFPHFLRFPCIGFESLISKIRPTGFIVTGLR